MVNKETTFYYFRFKAKLFALTRKYTVLRNFAAMKNNCYFLFLFLFQYCTLFYTFSGFAKFREPPYSDPPTCFRSCRMCDPSRCHYSSSDKFPLREYHFPPSLGLICTVEQAFYRIESVHRVKAADRMFKTVSPAFSKIL